ncbi:hypothetical protein AD998_00460 [bacterium 336/3]|nr:hypothetical protein AD998_00460 [bacterium 336/3]
MNLQDFCYQPHVGFEGRNQQYGAYELRKKYSKNLSTTLLVVVFSSATLFAAPIIKRAFLPKEEVVKQIDTSIEPTTTPIDILPKEPEIEKPKVTTIVIPPIQQPPVNQEVFQVIEIKDHKIDKKLTTNEELEDKNTAISNKKQDGDGAVNKPEETITDVKGKLMEGTGTEKEDNEVKEPFMLAQDAAFEGGINEFRKQLQKQIVYPSLARKKGTEGTVHLQFVVEKDGSISNISVLKGIGDGCDEESVRALEKITKRWASGKDAKGKSVRVRKTIPIKFALNQ